VTTPIRCTLSDGRTDKPFVCRQPFLAERLGLAREKAHVMRSMTPIHSHSDSALHYSRNVFADLVEVRDTSS
jgi:hypothetical protein